MLLCFCVFSVQAQTISPEIFENEEDLKDALERGSISYEEYLELSDLMLNKIQQGSDEEYELLVVPGISWGDLTKNREETYDSEEISASFSEKPKENTIGRATWQTYQKLDGEENLSNQFSLRFDFNNLFSLKSELSQETDNSLQIRKRSLDFFPSNLTKVIIGNYDKMFGLGINIGYHSLLSYAQNDNPNIHNQFLYPSKGRYNGVLIEQKLGHTRTSFFYSNSHWSDLENWLIGGDVSWFFKRNILGMTFSGSKLKRKEHPSSFEDNCVSLHFQTKYKTTNLLGEYAKKLESGDGFGLVLLSQNKNYSLDWSLWSYSSNFVHLHNGGPAQADYESINIEEIDYLFKSKQSGERGISLISKYKIMPKLKFNIGYSQWSESRDLPQKIRAKTGADYSLSEKYAFALEKYWMDNSLEQEGLDGQNIKFTFEGLPFSKFRFRIMVDYADKMLQSGKKEYGDVQLKINSSWLSPADLTFWVKCYDPDFNSPSDNKWRFYFEEKIKFSSRSYFTAGCGLRYNRLTDSIDDRIVRIKLLMGW